MKTSPDPPSSMERHFRKCAICTHPDREAIDKAFLHRSRCRVWADDSAQRTIVQIVKDYNLPSLSSLYRHAHATGLWLRRLNFNREPNRENGASPKWTPPQPNSNRESALPRPNSNRENKPGSDLPLTAEIQRMLIGK